MQNYLTLRIQNQQNPNALQLQITYSSCFLIPCPPVSLHSAVRLIFPNTFSSCHSSVQNPSIAAQYQQYKVHMPWLGIKPPLKSGSNFPLLPHFPLPLYGPPISLLHSTQLPLKRLSAFFFLLFSSTIRCQECSPFSVLWLHPNTSGAWCRTACF